MNKNRKVKIKPEKYRDLFINCCSGNARKLGSATAQIQLSIMVFDKKGDLIKDFTDYEAEKIYLYIEQLINKE